MDKLFGIILFVKIVLILTSLTRFNMAAPLSSLRCGFARLMRNNALRTRVCVLSAVFNDADKKHKCNIDNDLDCCLEGIHI